jgi:formylglycine-generating enzyme required for sulfatase activity
LVVDLRSAWGTSSFLYRWLCACAVYPLLRLDLTLYLGGVMAGARGGPGEAEALALVRLPWFRDGRMPDDVRLAFLRDLSEEDRRVVREAIERLLHAIMTGNRRAADGVVELDNVPPLTADTRASVRGLIASAPRAAAEGDPLFVGIMAGATPRAVDIEMGPFWVGSFAGSLPTWFDRRLLAVLAAALVATGGLWLAAGSVLRPSFETRISRLVEGPEMVELRGGSFLMGSPADKAGRYSNEAPRHSVSLASFAIARFEVTFDEWAVCVAQQGCDGYVPGDQGWGRGSRPVINVSWNDAQAYVAWLSRVTGARYRLPSEAEWEYAARAGTTSAYWWGNTSSTDRANYDGAVGTTREVGSYGPNPWGLYDTAGNVWEWVEDCWHEEGYAGAPSNGGSWTESCSGSGRVVRGGSWFNNPENARSAFRNWDLPDFRLINLGFRVSRTLTP